VVTSPEVVAAPELTVVADEPHPAATTSTKANPIASPMADVIVPQRRGLTENLLVASPSAGDDIVALVVIVLLFDYVGICSDMAIVH
jgi:hypothetical protein